VISVPGIWISEANGPTGSVVNYVLPAATDNDDPSPTVTCTPPPGQQFPLGETTVTCTATDDENNQSQATFTVLVQDTTPPVLTPPADLAVQSSTPVLLSDPRVQTFLGGATATDIVDTSVTVTTNAPDPLPTGTTVVTFRATDDAGNVAEATARITVTSEPVEPGPPTDTTPPGNVRNVRGLAGNLSVAISWRAPADRDFDHVRISRSPGTGGADSSQVYHGKGTRYVATNLVAGVEYRFVIVAFDKAGNRSAGVAVVTLAGRHPLLSPANGSAVGSPLRLRWRPVRGADYYNVQFWRYGRKLQSVWPRTTSYTLPRHWKYAGKQRALRPGEWQVFVWPGFGPRSQNRYGKVHVRAVFVVVRNR
jgi:hypothetical protein